MARDDSVDAIEQSSFRKCLDVHDAAASIVGIDNRNSLIRKHVACVHYTKSRKDHERIAACVSTSEISEFDAVVTRSHHHPIGKHPSGLRMSAGLFEHVSLRRVRAGWLTHLTHQ